MGLLVNGRFMEMNKNWLKAGQRNGKTSNQILINVNGGKAGSIGESHWPDYVQVKLYDKSDSRFLRVTMSPEEASNLISMLSKALKRVEE